MLECAGILFFRQEQLFSAAEEDVNLSDRDKVSVKVKTRQNTTDLKIEEKVDSPLNLALESRAEIKIRTR